MFKILIADDEGIMLESLKKIISSNFGQECEIKCVKSGRAVVEEAENFYPDIAFVDIHMPGLSGIQAIQEIRKFNQSMVIIIITAYDRFQYAQEAVNLGVMEYLTKPIASKKTIIDVCLRAMQRVEAARKKRNEDLQIKEKLEIVLPMLESGFIYSMVLDDGGIYWQDYSEFLGLEQTGGYCLVLEFGDDEERGKMTNAIGVSVRVNSVYPVLREGIKDFFSGIIGPLMGNRIIVFVPQSEQLFGYEERVTAITRTRNLIARLEEMADSKFRCGIGSPKGLERVRESYQEALRALRESESRVVHIHDIARKPEYDGEYPLDLENEFYARGLKGDVNGTIACGEEFFNWMEQHYSNHRSNIEVKVLELIMQLEYRAFFEGRVKYGFEYRQNYLRELQEADSLMGLRRWFIGKIDTVCNLIANSGKKESEQLVAEVKDYIKKNYHRDISLDDVSRMVNISPYYFSKLFKQEVGGNFIEYLTKIRIMYACRLLRDPNYSVKEVCAKVGYSDPNYFSRIFKKYEGVPPSEYREQKKGEKNET